MIRRAILLTLAVCYIVFQATTAWAKDKVLTFEELLAIDTPCTVSVRAKTDEAKNMSGSYLTTATTWALLIKNSKGEYVKTELKIDMEQYDKMSFGERDHVLNHKEFTLTVMIDENGRWTSQYGEQTGNGNREYYGMMILFLLVFVAMLLPKRVQTSRGYTWKPSVPFILLSFLSAPTGKKKKW